ncbi:uncharacterized protein TNCV_1282981 [Trichonephila clavipes]|uniref:Uncharacterized protein n=1 Tax=Trichonephila clavipes TaxID=2585209 RepID=A0A8X6VQ65_TRICX|nr:uncharacterized protein TNCV_1282981 [Trichonephila clavipes]
MMSLPVQEKNILLNISTEVYAQFKADVQSIRRACRSRHQHAVEWLPSHVAAPRGPPKIATAGSDVVQPGRPIFDDFFQHLWPYIGNNTANVVFQMVKRLWLIRIDQ